MNRLVTYGTVDSIPFYNCSWKSSEEWWETGVKRPLLGYPVFIIGVIIELLYIPVIHIIFRTRLIRFTCYKIMTVLAVMDMSATACSSLITGVLLIQGAVYCSYPEFIYVAGGFVLSTWCCSCAITVSLFLNRIISIACKEYSDKIEKRVAFTSMIICFCYMSYINCFTPPIFFNSNIMAWLPDPLSEPEPSDEAAEWYHNITHDLNNWIYCLLMFILFSVYYILVKNLAQGQNSKTSRAIFIQCSIICVFNTTCAVIYNALALITLAPWILVFCQLCWSVNHGIPAIIYVTMNDTIRREFKKLICGRTSHRIDDKRSSLSHMNSISQSRL